MNSMVALGKKFTRNIQDNKRRLLSAKYELRRKLYKAFVQDPQLPPEMREAHRYKLSKLPRNSSFTRIRNVAFILVGLVLFMRSLECLVLFFVVWLLLVLCRVLRKLLGRLHQGFLLFKN